MSNRRAKRPLDPDAVAKANEAVYAEMKKKGEEPRALTMGPEDYEYRKQWMDAYLAAGGQAEENTSKKKAGGSETKCPPGSDHPMKGSSTHDNEINIEFDPEKSEKAEECKRIVFVQTVQKVADGKPIMPGEYYEPWKYKDDDALTDGEEKGLRVDYLKGEKTPYYNDPQNTGSSPYGDVGSTNGESTKATMGDGPNTGGGDNGFYDEDSNPDGYHVVRTVFETFAMCAEGPDCGKYYEGIRWNHIKTYEDQKAGNKGQSHIVGYPTEPTAGFKKALKKWLDRYGFKPCE